ncbi:MAG TPA: transcriptional regulator GcvA [Polyangiales bacterium]|nr:transcriptional regulator GcvA [Polyangiales bacterium]
MPPLGALHAFEAAARLLSFKAAAEELHVTPGAVSQQIKLLEDRLGAQLFTRRARSIELTDAGRLLLSPAQQAFRMLADAVARIRASDGAQVLTVSLLPSFAALWLVPRLGTFRLRCPDVDVRISATPKVADLERDDVDIAVRCGLGNYPGLHVEHLLAEDLFPVCSPRLRKGLKKPADLAHHTLLHDETRTEWALWLQAIGLPDLAATRGPSFSLWELALQAAVAGQGVALGRSALVTPYLESGQLVRPFQISTPSAFAYYVVCLPQRAQEPKIAAFRAWLQDEVAGSAQLARETSKR